MKKRLLFTLLLFSSVSFGQIVDGSFEAGTGAGIWNESSTNFGFVICNTGSCGNGGGEALANTGNNWVWIGGAGAGNVMPEISLIEQLANVPNGVSASLNMQVKLFESANVGWNPLDTVYLYADGNIIWSASSSDSTTYDNYAPVSIDIATYADGNDHMFTIMGKQNIDTITFSAIFDDLYLNVDGQIIGLFELENKIEAKAYPNPTDKIINFDIPASSTDTEITITNLNGQIVSMCKLSNVNGQKATIDVSSFNDGFYLFTIKISDELIHGKFEVRH